MFQRYAVYYLPDDAGLAAFGASWLGWDVSSGVVRAHPDVDGLAEATGAPRKYGFHGTLKPPFKLAEGTDAAALQTAVAKLAERAPAFELDGLSLSRIGSFLALVPKGNTSRLAHLAIECVTKLDSFRRAPEAAELQRRRKAGLSPRQDALLEQWGYPYVADEFRFHLTLTGKLNAPEQDRFLEVLRAQLPPLPAPFPITSIALVGARSDGKFQLIHRYALTG